MAHPSRTAAPLNLHSGGAGGECSPTSRDTSSSVVRGGSWPRCAPIFQNGRVALAFPARDTAPDPVSLADYHRSVAVTRGPAGKTGAGAAAPEPDACREVPTVIAAANPDERWLRNARYARWLAWASLGWM